MRRPIPIALAFLLLTLNASASDLAQAWYSGSLRDHYPTRGRDKTLDEHELEDPVIVWDESNRRRATINRTRGDCYPYEDQKCVIEIDGAGLEESRCISARGFRTVNASWISGKLILIELGIGRVAAVEAIYDVEQDDWVYRESVQYSD